MKTTTKSTSVTLVALFAAVMLTACSLPKPAPSVTQHDLGGVFPVSASHPAVSLRAVQVTAQPLVATTAMLYREASDPTRRGVYALNRWAATPASMVEAALSRQLAPEGNGRCRLQYSLGEFIIDVDAAGHARALIAADATVIRDAVLGAGGTAAERAAAGIPATALRRGFDIAVPMTQVGPSQGAMALREAVRQLGEASVTWLNGQPARMCAG